MTFASTEHRIRSLAEAIRWREMLLAPVVLTNGVFDLLHRGHVEYLEAARAEGSHLVVGVNSDQSARTLGKSAGRPFVPEADRARVLASLAAVDCVVLFEEPTPIRVIEALRPDVLVKGGDYTRETVVGADLVEARGGRVVLVPFVPHQSTTRLVEQIRASS